MKYVEYGEFFDIIIKMKADNYGWGRVYRDYPRNYNFLKNNEGDSYYYLIKEENDTNLRYTRIYRYIGK